MQDSPCCKIAFFCSVCFGTFVFSWVEAMIGLDDMDHMVFDALVAEQAKKDMSKASNHVGFWQRKPPGSANFTEGGDVPSASRIASIEIRAL